MQRTKRQEKILYIIDTDNIENQQQLTEVLNKEGFRVTQATVSRDMKELGLSKRKGIDGVAYYKRPIDPKLSKLKTLFHQSVTKIDSTQNIIVIKTLSGSANSACSLIDKINHPYIVGTIAGDDTIIIVVRSSEVVPTVLKLLESYRD
ncbi:MAG: arginine repressor [Clostridiales bacterium]|jgi:transcriptional regulator of arginine metabolism|nr:arginine repressor [Clostridiales bacterium]